MSYALRNYRHRNPQTQEQQQPGQSFFKQAGQHAVQTKKETPFFQAKLSVGEPSDQYEQEADAVANTVVNHTAGNVSVVQQKKISGIQRLSTSKEEEKLSTDEERMKRDKEIQTKPEIQRMCPECEKEKKEKGVQQKADPEKEKEKKKMSAVQKKPEAGGGTASPQVSSKIEQSAGKGNALSGNALVAMQSSFGVDFSNVNIHTDTDAVSMNKELGAQAFTHGSDIYFNRGKYNPESSDGKRLLAHELTHVVQQNGNQEEMPVQRSCSANANEAHYQSAPNYCQDGTFSSLLHSGQNCYREVPVRTADNPCPGGDQVCFDPDGTCHDSYDKASPVAGKDSDGSCDIEYIGGCGDAHRKEDKVLETFWDIYIKPTMEDIGKGQITCQEACAQQPWYMQGFCLQGCGGGMMPM